MNRFNKSTSTFQSFQHPYDLLYQIGSQKEKNIEDFVTGIQGQVNLEGNYDTIYSPDTDYKVNKTNELLSQINDFGKANLDDAIVQGKIKSSVGAFANDREVLNGIQRTNAYTNWLKEKEKLGPTGYRPQNDPFLQLSHLYETTGNKDAGNALRVFQGIDPYFDTDKQIHETLSKNNVSLDSNTIANGIFFETNKSNNGVTAYTKDSNGKLIPADTKLNNAIRTLPLGFFDQMQKDWAYYAKDKGINYSDYLNQYLEDAVVAATQTEHSLDQRSAEWERFNYQKQKDLESQRTGTPMYVPGVPQQLQPEDLKSVLRAQFGVTKNTFDPEHPFSGNVNKAGLFFGIPEGSTDDNSPTKLTETQKDKFNEYIGNLKTQISSELGKQINSPNLKNSLKLHNLTYTDGKLNGTDSDIEDYYVSALQNSNTNAMDSYTLPNLDPNRLSTLLVNLARNGNLPIAVNGTSPSNANQARQTLLADVTANKGFSVVVNPTNMYGHPTIDVVTSPTDKEPSKTYNIGLDQNTMRYFQGVSNLTQSMIKGETGKEIPIWSIPVKEGMADIIAKNSFKVDQNGNTYIGTDLYAKDPTTKELVPYSDYKTFMQGTIIPAFENSDEMYPYTNKENLHPSQVTQD